MSAFAQKFARVAQKSRHYATVRKEQQLNRLQQPPQLEKQQPVATRKRQPGNQFVPNTSASKRVKTVRRIVFYTSNSQIYVPVYIEM